MNFNLAKILLDDFFPSYIVHKLTFNVPKVSSEGGLDFSPLTYSIHYMYVCVSLSLCLCVCMYVPLELALLANNRATTKLYAFNEELAWSSGSCYCPLPTQGPSDQAFNYVLLWPVGHDVSCGGWE